MSSPQSPGARRRSEGFALVLAILALLLLTFLGLTLAVTTSTELQIATNYKWGQQARTNAEAGIEAGKRVLRDMDWSLILPQARPGTWTTTTTLPAVPFTGATRNFENSGCDTTGGEGYGVVLNDGVNRYENLTAVPTFPATVGGVSTALRGAFTLWIRRPLVRDQDGTYSDYNADNTTLVLTSEGTAPFAPITPGGTEASFHAVNRAVYVMEVKVSQNPLPPCGTRAGQQGGGQAGAGFAACTTLGDDALTRELQAIGGAVGTGAQLNGGSGN